MLHIAKLETGVETVKSGLGFLCALMKMEELLSNRREADSEGRKDKVRENHIYFPCGTRHDLLCGPE
jgi:hypothetical protein